MKKNLTHKILEAHLLEGRLVPGKEIAIKIDQTLLQDATGTMAMLQFEAMGIDRVKTDLAVQYVDHNLLQTDNKNADDHKYLQTACNRYGIVFSAPGNGVSHQVHMERFGVPGTTLLGADSHTPGAAGISCLAIGAGGLDVAMAMAGFPYYLPCPKVLGVKLTGSLPDWVSAKDIILELLRRYDVNGCMGKIIEYYGPGVQNLSATDRETIGNMGTETGATSTVFPSDENTRTYMKSQGREDSWKELHADEDSEYDEYAEIDLASIEPLIATPSSPGNVVPVRDVAGIKVDQVIVGSSVNSSFRDLMVTAKILQGRHIHPNVSMHINPGSRQVVVNIIEKGGGIPLLQGGAVIKEPGCLGCIGMGQAPGIDQVSLRTFPRNFPGRSGTVNDKVYLCSPETAAAAALTGVITDPRDLSSRMDYPRIEDPENYTIDEKSIYFPDENDSENEIVRGPNIKPFPNLDSLPDNIEAEVVIKVEDNISTDHIMPAGNEVLPLRSNIEAISRYVYYKVDSDFHQKCKRAGTAAVVGGENYGQGSSREHAALAPRYLGVRIKIAKSFARIHKANLCNFGVVPLEFKEAGDYEGLKEGDKLVLRDIRRRIENGDTEIPVELNGGTITAIFDVSERQRKNIVAGGAINLVTKADG